MRSAQAAIEYLFMVALALTMVLIAVRLMHQTAQTAAEQINETSKELLEILQNMTGNHS
jgi:ABC-type transporter MlaC component